MPVVCVRVNEDTLERLEDRARRKGMDRSGWLRSLVLKDLGLDKATSDVEVLAPTPPQAVDVLVPGDTLTVVNPPDPRLPPGAIRP